MWRPSVGRVAIDCKCRAGGSTSARCRRRVSEGLLIEHVPVLDLIRSGDQEVTVRKKNRLSWRSILKLECRIDSVNNRYFWAI